MTTEPDQLADQFLNEYRQTGVYLQSNISRLAELALSRDSTIARDATRAIFASLVEPLADSFEPSSVTLYNQAFAQMIEACRTASGAGELDGELSRFGLTGEGDITRRAESLRRVRPFARLNTDIQRVLVLSRVTLGADVAISSIIIDRIKTAFPHSEVF